MQVAIIGAGPLGRWLALAAGRAGYKVLLEDVMPSNLHHAQEYLRQQLGPAALPKVMFAGTIEEAVREADLAIDCVPDELESKLEIFWLLDRMAPPRTVLVTPTKKLSIADLASCTYRADKCVALVANVQELTGASIDNGRGAGERSGNSVADSSAGSSGDGRDGGGVLETDRIHTAIRS